MLVVKTLAAGLLFAGAVAADGASIVAALDAVAAKTVSLGGTVASWDGGLLGALPITIQSAELLNSIKEGTKTAQASTYLNDIETFTVAVATQALAQDVNQTLTTLMAARAKFDHLLLRPVILLNLEFEKKATDDFSAAVVSKVPAELQAAAETLVAQIDASFDLAIDYFQLF